MDFKYARNIDSDTPIMLMDDSIGINDDGCGIDVSLFCKELMELDSMGKKTIALWINSVGGSVIAGMQINFTILNIKAKVDTYCMGLCASMGAFLFESGRKRYMADYGKLMFHGTRGSNDPKVTDELTDSCAKMVSSKTGKSYESVFVLMGKKDIWIGAEEAKVSGLCDEILISSDYNSKRMSNTSASEIELMKVAAALIEEQLITKDNNKQSIKMATEASDKVSPLDLTKVYSELRIAKNSDQDVIVEAIQHVNAKLNTANATAKALQEENAVLTEKLNKAEADLGVVKAQKEAQENAAKIELQKAEAEADLQMVTAFAEIGKIKKDDESINHWVGVCAKLGRAEAKTLIDGLPLNKVGADMANKKTDSPVSGAVARMAQEQSKSK